MKLIKEQTDLFQTETNSKLSVNSLITTTQDRHMYIHTVSLFRLITEQ